MERRIKTKKDSIRKKYKSNSNVMRNFLEIKIKLRPHSSDKKAGESIHSRTSTTSSHSDSTATGIRGTASPFVGRRLSMGEGVEYRGGGDEALSSTIRNADNTGAVGDQLHGLHDATTTGNRYMPTINTAAFKYPHHVINRAEKYVSFQRRIKSSLREVTNRAEKIAYFPWCFAKRAEIFFFSGV